MSIKNTITKLKTNWNNAPSPDRFLSFKEIGSYGVGGMGINFIINLGYLILSAQIMPIAFGIIVLHAQIIIIIVAFLTLIFCPLIGNIMDNTVSRWGKLKPYFLIFVPLFAFFIILATFSPQFDNPSYRIIYAYVTCIPTLFLQQLNVSLFNLYPTVMTPNSQERQDMLSPASLIYCLAPTVLSVLLGPLREYYKRQGMEFMAFRVSGIAFTIIGLGLAYLLFRNTKERVYITEKVKEKIKLITGLKYIVKNKPFIMYLFFNMFNGLKVLLIANIVLIAEYKYTSNGIGGLDIYGPLTLITGFGATPAIILAPLLSRKFTKKNIIIFTQLISTLMLAALVVVGFDNIPNGIVSIVIFTLLVFVQNLATGSYIVYIPSMLSELIDYQQFMTNKRLDGFMNTINMWFCYGFGTLLGLIPALIQKTIGFEQGLAIFRPDRPEFNIDFALPLANKWFQICAIISLVATIIALIPLIFYSFNDRNHKDIIEEIKSRSLNVSMSPTDSETLITL